MSPRARRARLAVTGLVAVLLLAGTIAGQDDHFPFGPFRMYSTSTSGQVLVLKLEGTTATGATVPIDFNDLGLRRAEVDGQLPLFRADPARLRYLAAALRARGGPELTGVHLFQDIYPLVDGRPGTPRARTVASWTRP